MGQECSTSCSLSQLFALMKLREQLNSQTEVWFHVEDVGEESLEMKMISVYLVKQGSSKILTTI